MAQRLSVVEQLKAYECSLSYALLPESVKIENAAGQTLENGVDYYFDAVWGAFGRTPDARIGAEDAGLYLLRLSSAPVGRRGRRQSGQLLSEVRPDQRRDAAAAGT